MRFADPENGPLQLGALPSQSGIRDFGTPYTHRVATATDIAPADFAVFIGSAAAALQESFRLLLANANAGIVKSFDLKALGHAGAVGSLHRKQAGGWPPLISTFAALATWLLPSPVLKHADRTP